MLAWILGLAMLGLLGVLLRMWSDFANRQRQLVADQQKVSEKTQHHLQALETIREKTLEAEEEAEEARGVLMELEKRVLLGREQLVELQQKESRRSPTRHRVDTSDDDSS